MTSRLARLAALAALGFAASAPLAADLDALVGRIALYPDDLVAIILPASTKPLQVVQADRFLEKRKADPKLPVDEKWDDAVKALLNYPQVVTNMSRDLDWTAALGEAVAADLGAVLEAVQAFRRKAQAAGNLKSDDKQSVVIEKEIITIVPTNPQVIYVPQYDPVTVVVYGGYPYYWPYYGFAYPVYYYPYAPGAAIAVGVVWGIAIGAAWQGGHHVVHYGNNNINIDRRPGTPSQLPAGGTPSPRVGDASGARPATRDSAFSGGSSGNQARLDSSRGAASRGAMMGGGGARMGGGGGGRRR